MTDEAASVMLEILKRLQADIAEIRSDMHLMRMEMTAMRHDLSSLRTMQDVHVAEIATLKTRVERIERRLDLAD